MPLTGRSLRIGTLVACGSLVVLSGCGNGQPSASTQTAETGETTELSTDRSAVLDEVPPLAGMVFGDHAGTTSIAAVSAEEQADWDETRLHYEQLSQRSEDLGLPDVLRPLVDSLPDEAHVVGDFLTDGARACLASAGEAVFEQCLGGGTISFELDDASLATLQALNRDAGLRLGKARFEFTIVRDMSARGDVRYIATSARVIALAQSDATRCESEAFQPSPDSVPLTRYGALHADTGAGLPALEFYGMSRRADVVPFQWGISTNKDGTFARNEILAYFDAPEIAQQVANITGLPTVAVGPGPCG